MILGIHSGRLASLSTMLAFLFVTEGVSLSADRQLSTTSALAMSIGGFVLPIGTGIGLNVAAREMEGKKSDAVDALGGALLAYGAVVGPSTAHLYLGEYLHTFAFAAIRSLAGYLAYYTPRGELAYIGLFGYTAAVGYDFYDSTRAALRQPKVSVAPLVIPDRGVGIRVDAGW